MTCDPDRIFMTPAQALAAIRFDFRQYGAQPELLCELCPLIFGSGTAVVEDSNRRGFWVPRKRRGPMCFVPTDRLPEYLLTLIENKPFCLDRLAGVCSIVFRIPTWVGSDNGSPQKGIWFATGLETFSCRQCGQCCLTLDYRNECTAGDIELWHELGRADVLDWVGTVRRGGKIAGYRIWVTPGTNRCADVCPWLEKIHRQDRYRCRIHDVKPDICCQYPGTRKHAEMTGCPGFE